MIQAAKEAARKVQSIAKMGNQNAVGNGASKLGNTNSRGNKGNTRPGSRPDQIGNTHAAKYNWNDARDQLLIDGVTQHGNKWQKIRRQSFLDWFPEDIKFLGNKALKNRYDSLKKSNDKRIAESKAASNKKQKTISSFFA